MKQSGLRLGFAVTMTALVGMVSLDANASSRQGATTRLSVGANVASPWVLQLKPKYRRLPGRKVTKSKRLRRAANRAKARRAAASSARRSSNLDWSQTASIPPASPAKLRSSITPSFHDSLLPTVVSYYSDAKPGTLIVNTPERRLYLVMPGGKARRYAIGVGKPGFEWSGEHRVSRKAEWPDWRPPAEMIARERKKGRELPEFMPGGPKNPLGARALYLGSTIYRIHGTNQAWSIGKAVSSGCIRMRNEDVMDLYERIPIGAKVQVI